MPRITILANTHNNIYSDHKAGQKHYSEIDKEQLLAKTGKSDDDCFAEIVTIGSSCSVPTPDRGLPCTLLSIGKVKLIFDYGDGATQKLLRFVDFGRDEVFVFFTHDHPDHWTGLLALPGIIYTILIEKKPIKKIHLYANLHVANFLVKFLKSNSMFDGLRKYFDLNCISKHGSYLDGYPDHDTQFETDAEFNRTIRSFSEGKRKAPTPQDLDLGTVVKSITSNTTVNIKNFNSTQDFISVKWSSVSHVPSSLAFRVNVGTFLFSANTESFSNAEIDHSSSLPEFECLCSVGITGDAEYAQAWMPFSSPVRLWFVTALFQKDCPTR